MGFPNKYSEQLFAERKAFVIVWQGAASMTEVCQRLEMNSREASNIAASLRRRGVQLKNMPHPGNGGDMIGLSEDHIYELARLADQFNAAAAGEATRKKVSRIG